MKVYSGIHMSLFGSITGIAKQVTGSVSGFRQVLNTNPKMSSFIFPPQVALGIKVAGVLGIKVPTPDDLVGVVNKQITNTLTDIRKPASGILDSVENLIKKVPTDSSVETVINSIDWLIG